MSTQPFSRKSLLAMMAALTITSANGAFAHDKNAAASGDAHVECNEPEYTSGHVTSPRGSEVHEVNPNAAPPVATQDMAAQPPTSHHWFTIRPTDPFRESGA